MFESVPRGHLSNLDQTKCFTALWTYHPASFMSVTVMYIQSKQLNHELVHMDQMHMK